MSDPVRHSQQTLVQASIPHVARLWDTTTDVVQACGRNFIPDDLRASRTLVHPKATRDPLGGLPMLKDAEQPLMVSSKIH